VPQIKSQGGKKSATTKSGGLRERGGAEGGIRRGCTHPRGTCGDKKVSNSEKTNKGGLERKKKGGGNSCSKIKLRKLVKFGKGASLGVEESHTRGEKKCSARRQRIPTWKKKKGDGIYEGRKVGVVVTVRGPALVCKENGGRVSWDRGGRESPSEELEIKVGDMTKNTTKGVEKV